MRFALKRRVTILPQRAHLPPLKPAKPGEAAEQLSLGYLMQALWLGGRLQDAKGLPVADSQAWVRLAGAADYSLKRRAIIQEALLALCHQMEPNQRPLFAQRPRLSRLQVRLTHLRDDQQPLEERRVVSGSYRAVILRCAWALYGEALWQQWLSSPPTPPTTLEGDLNGSGRGVTVPTSPPTFPASIEAPIDALIHASPSA